MSIDTTTIDKRLAHLIDQQQSIAQQIACLSVVAIAQRVRAAQPEAETVNLIWSGQGPHLTVEGYITAAGHQLGYSSDGAWMGGGTWAGSWEDRLNRAIAPYVVNLSENNQAAWEPFTRENPASDAGGRLLAIDDVLTWHKETDTTAAIEAFIGWTQLVGIIDEDLDEYVHELVSQGASEINNGGIAAQVEYLIESCGVNEARKLLVQCEPGEPHPLHAIASMRGIMQDGYDDRTVNSVLGSISDASGMRLVCLWDYIDEYGPGGNSDFFIEVDDQLHELVGDLRGWLIGNPADAQTPHFPGAPSTWLGPAVQTAEQALLTDDRHNYAARAATHDR